MNLAARTEALLALVAAYEAGECERLRAPALAQAAQIRRAARAEARRRVATAAAEARADIAQAVAQATAQWATASRLQAQRRASALLAQGWGELRAALERLWQTPASRAAWIDRQLARAVAALPAVDGVFTLALPAALAAAEAEQACARLRTLGAAQVVLRADATLACGLRVLAGANVFDATLDGLLAQRAMLEGRLLQALDLTPAAAVAPAPASPPEAA